MDAFKTFDHVKNIIESTDALVGLENTVNATAFYPIVSFYGLMEASESK